MKMDIIFVPLYNLIDMLLGLYEWAIILSVVLSWLLGFGVINPYHPFVSRVGEFLFRITEPVLYPIRTRLPSLGGLDISPFILLLGVHLLRNILERFVLSLMA
jgi:YggT family protein